MDRIAKVRTLLNEANVSACFSSGSDCVLVEPKTKQSGLSRPDLFDGMSLVYYPAQDKFEVLEAMAGKNQNQLKIYTRTPYAAVAVRSLLKGNKRAACLEVW